jgi:hypothetical protein
VLTLAINNVAQNEEAAMKMLLVLGVRKPQSTVLTQNQHPASSTQQAEQASFTREKIPRRASQFFLKINKRQSS